MDAMASQITGVSGRLPSQRASNAEVNDAVLLQNIRNSTMKLESDTRYSWHSIYVYELSNI